MEGRLTGKVAIVTGAARGLGRSISLSLADEGADVVAADLASDTTTNTSYAMGSMDDLNETTAMIQQRGRQGKAVRADVTQDEDCRQLAEATIESFGGVDILVSNAGIFSMGLAWELSEEQWDRVLAVNLKGAWLVTRHVVPHMVRQRSGRVVFTASTNGLKADTHFSHYCAAKHGLIGYMKALAIESGPYNINVNAVCPTNMETIGAVTAPEEDPTFAQYTFDEMTTIVREAHRLKLMVCAHAEGLDGIRVAIAAGVDTLEHRDELYRDPALLDQMRAAGTILVPTLALFESLAEHPEVSHACDHVRDRARELRQRHLRSFRLALERGVTIAMGSDAADPYNRHGCNTRELALMVKAGMSPAAALVAATRNAAQACGLAEELGTVESGKRADVLVVDGDPLTDITCLQRREAVWLVFQAGNPVAGSTLTPQIPILNLRDQGVLG